MSVEAILKDVREIKVKVNKLYEANKPRQTWVNATWLKEMTGWSGERMREAREMDVVEYRKKKSGSYEYLVQSLDDKFLIKN